MQQQQPSTALPLKVAPSYSPAKSPSPDASSRSTTPAPKPMSVAPVANPSDISSPHELTAYVESLLEQLDAKFDDMSTQILDRMMQMSARVDALEASIQDIINSDITNAPLSPSPATPTPSTPNPRRGGSTPQV